MGIRGILHPKRVAIVGASDNANRIGGRPIAYTLEAGYSGAIIPVTRKYNSVQGLSTVASLAELEEPVDVAVLAIPANALMTAIEEGSNLVRNYIVYSAGLGETGAEGKQREMQLSRLAKQNGARLLGPNCVGLVNGALGLNLAFTVGFEGMRIPKNGKLGIVSQSGAFGVYIFGMAVREELGPTQFISTGNEADIDAIECLEEMLNDDSIETVILYIEAEPDGERFRRCMELADGLGKVIILVRPGVTDAGRRLAKSHTGSVLEHISLLDKAIEGHNVVRAESTRQVMQLARALTRATLPRGPRVGIITLSGGAAILMADAAEKYKLELPTMSSNYQQLIKDMVPFAEVNNPVDVTAQFINDTELVKVALEGMARESNIDAIALFLSHVISVPSVGPALIEAIEKCDRNGIPLFIGGYGTRKVRRDLGRVGVPVYKDPVDCMETIGLLASMNNKCKLFERSGELNGNHAVQQSLGEVELYDEVSVKEFLRTRGFDVPDGEVVEPDKYGKIDGVKYRFLENADAHCRWAVKVVHKYVHHKTRLGGIVLNVEQDDLGEAILGLVRILDAKALDGGRILVENMVSEMGTEVILSVRQDSNWGKFLIVGQGGTSVETNATMTMVRIPCSVEAVEMALDRDCSGWLNGDGHKTERYRVACVAKRYADAIGSVMSQDTVEVECNPVILGSTSRKVWVLDATVYHENEGEFSELLSS